MRVTVCKVSEFNENDHVDCKNPATVQENEIGLFTDFPSAKLHWQRVFDVNNWRGDWYQEFGGIHWTWFKFRNLRVRVVLQNHHVLDRDDEI